MDRYNPELGPDANEWLQLDEDERLIPVEEYHRDARIFLPRKIRQLHATIHVVVENQLALNDEPVVRALGRLVKEGLSRHDAVHAIGSRAALSRGARACTSRDQLSNRSISPPVRLSPLDKRSG